MASNKGVRPLSPHLGVWRWPVTMATSIFHRATGVGNALGLLLVTWFLTATAAGPEAYGTFAGFAAHPLGQLILFGFLLSVIYHLLNGVRHLFWDGGKGFALGTASMWSWLVMLLSLVAAVGTWFLIPGTMLF